VKDTKTAYRGTEETCASGLSVYDLACVPPEHCAAVEKLADEVAPRIRRTLGFVLAQQQVVVVRNEEPRHQIVRVALDDLVTQMRLPAGMPMQNLRCVRAVNPSYPPTCSDGSLALNSPQAIVRIRGDGNHA
jgi:hypothetical protein